MDFEGFEERVRLALRVVERVLLQAKRPALASDVPHTYSDKYALVESATNVGVLALLHVFELLGLSQDGVLLMVEWSASRAVRLEFRMQEACSFDRKEEREVEETGPSSLVNPTSIHCVFRS
jgi:hypothetical protein